MDVRNTTDDIDLKELSIDLQVKDYNEYMTGMLSFIRNGVIEDKWGVRETQRLNRNGERKWKSFEARMLGDVLGLQSGL